MKYELEQFMLQREAEIELGDEKIPAMGAAAKPAPKKKKSWNDSNRSCSEKQPRRFAIVNCASTAGLHGMPEFSAYCASKHAIIGLTKSAALEYAAHNIRINALCPSTTDTPMVERFQSQWPEWQAAQNDSIPVGRIGTPEEMANAVVWMLSDQCTFMTGHCLCVDGGGTC
jgi:NAD(P)-dependent dehydrogenase (short-subunit alcohol dehydrogenase family)